LFLFAGSGFSIRALLSIENCGSQALAVRAFGLRLVVYFFCVVAVASAPLRINSAMRVL
jgi:hypothetical protein